MNNIQYIVTDKQTNRLQLIETYVIGCIKIKASKEYAIKKIKKHNEFIEKSIIRKTEQPLFEIVEENDNYKLTLNVNISQVHIAVSFDNVQFDKVDVFSNTLNFKKGDWVHLKIENKKIDRLIYMK